MASHTHSLFGSRPADAAAPAAVTQLQGDSGHAQPRRAGPFVERWQRMRIAAYRLAWTCPRVTGSPDLISPVVLKGEGEIRFAPRVTLGWAASPGHLSGHSYIEARGAASVITIGEGTHCNNEVALISEGEGISIGARCLMGPGVHIYDSDFHALDPDLRGLFPPRTGRVTIGCDVFLGSRAQVLKGVSIGDGAVIGAGAIVARDVPARTVAAGNPAVPVGSV